MNNSCCEVKQLVKQVIHIFGFYIQQLLSIFKPGTCQPPVRVWFFEITFVQLSVYLCLVCVLCVYAPEGCDKTWNGKEQNGSNRGLL